METNKVWNKFDNYWNSTKTWKSINREKILDILKDVELSSNIITVPQNTEWNRKVGKTFYDNIHKLLCPDVDINSPFQKYLSYTINTANDETLSIQEIRNILKDSINFSVPENLNDDKWKHFNDFDKKVRQYFSYSFTSEKPCDKNIKMLLWNHYFGINDRTGKCFVGCGRTIENTNFECGHVLSKSNEGDNSLENLRPICRNCNSSMKDTHLYAYMKEKFPDRYNECIKKSNQWFQHPKDSHIKEIIKRIENDLSQLKIYCDIK